MNDRFRKLFLDPDTASEISYSQNILFAKKAFPQVVYNAVSLSSSSSINNNIW